MVLMKNRMKELNLKQKLKYLWDYYRWLTIGVLLIFILTFVLIKNISFNNVKYDAYCLILNDPNNTALVDKIKEGFPIYLNNDKFLINVDNGYPFSYIEEHGLNWPDESSNVKIISITDTNKADVAIADYKTLLWAVHTKYIYPLDEILPADLYKVLEPYFVYAYFQGDNNKTDGKVYGLNISDTKIYKENSNNYKDAVIFIPNLAVEPNQIVQHDVAIDFIKYLFEIK